MPTFEHPWSDLDEARYRLVHEHLGGTKALGALTGINPGTLANKVNPDMHSHHLTVDEAVRIQAVRRVYGLLYAEARALGHVCIRLEDHSGVSDLSLLDSYAQYHADIGETAQAVRRALDAGEGITRAALEEVRRELYQDAQAGFELLARLEALVEDRDDESHGR